MPEIHLKQLGFTYSACSPFTKSKERIKKLKETGHSRHIYQNELDKARFEHDMTYGDFKDLNIKRAADKVLLDKAFNIAKSPKYDGYQRGLASMVYNSFDKKLQVELFENENSFNKELAEELHKPVIRKLNKTKVSFIDNIWGADLADKNLKIYIFIMCY